MGFRSIDSEVNKLIAWADVKLKNPLLRYEPCEVYLERSTENCLLFGKSPCVRARIEDHTNGKVYFKANFSLYPLVPPIFGLCAESMTLELLERSALILRNKSIPYKSTLEIK